MKDNVMPEGKWEFNQEVTNCFDEMLERSIPAYSDMRELVKRIGKRYVKRKTAIVDLGCSTGEAIQPFISAFGCQNTYKLYDVSEPMLNACRERYKNWINEGILSCESFDIRNGLPQHLFTSLVLSVLTLQFTPIEYRLKIIQSIYEKTMRYFVPDNEMFRAGMNDYRKLDLPLEDGFGPLAQNADEALKAIIDIVNRNGEAEEHYKSKMDNFFLNSDKNCRERIYNQIK